MAETLDAEVQLRTKELEQRNAEVVLQSEQLEIASRSLQAQDAERRHIARELHDSAGQTLAALGMILSQLSEVSSGDIALVSSCAEECQPTGSSFESGDQNDILLVASSHAG